MNIGQANAFHLANLPPDIIRLILQMEKPESIDYLRLISPSWKSLIDEYLTSNQLPTLDFLCLNFITATIVFDEILRLEMIIIGRKSRFCGAETFTQYYVVDRQFLRILKRCSKIDTLLLNVPVGSRPDERWFHLIRPYVVNTPVRLVKVASLRIIDDVVRNVLNNLAYFNAVRNFEIEVKSIEGCISKMLNSMPLHGKRSFKLFDYTHKPSSLFCFQKRKEMWEDFAKSWRKNGQVQAIFNPDNVEYHLQIVQTPTQSTIDWNSLLSNTRTVITPTWGKSAFTFLPASIARIRDEIEKIKIAIAKLQTNPSFDLNKFLLCDHILLSLNCSEKFEKAPENESNLSNLPLEISLRILRMEKPECIDDLRLISPRWKMLVDEFLSNINNMPIIEKCLEFAESPVNPLKVRLETIGMFRNSAAFRDDWTEYLTSDPRFYRIQRRCSRIETLHLKMPSGSHVDHETIEILRLYVGTTPVRLVKITGLAKFDIFARNVCFHLARVNGARYFEVDTRLIDGSQLDYFLKITTNLIKSIKFRDYGHKSHSTFYFKEDESIWRQFETSMNARGTVFTVFLPFGEGFHLKIATIPETRRIANDQPSAIPNRSGTYHSLTFNTRQVHRNVDLLFAPNADGSQTKSKNQWFTFPKPDPNREIANSIKIIREELKKIRKSVRQLQSSSTFDLVQFIASDSVLIALRHYLTR